MGLRRLAAGAALCAVAACGTDPGPEGPGLAERLQGNWSREESLPDSGFVRMEYATLAVRSTTIHYTYYIAWECPDGAACPGEPPPALGNYFEGIFEDRGKTLALKDALEPVSFRFLNDSTLVFTASGLEFELKRR